MPHDHGHDAHDHGHPAHAPHGRGHAHHRHGRGADARRLAVVLGLSAAYLVAEVVGGLLTNSLALLADAGHMLSDVGALALALFALWAARRPPSGRWTYGFHRTEILAALANGATLVAASVYVFVEAWRRLGAPPEVHGGGMMAVAAGGLAVNLVGLAVLSRGRSGSLNVRGAWLHVLTDALGSVGAVGAGALVWAFGWNWADPAASALIGALVLYSAWGLLRETVAVLMEGAPGGVDVDAVRRALLGVPGAVGLHDLHVWTITSGLVALSAHVTAGPERAGPDLLADLRRAVEPLGVDHVTIQVEPEGFEERDLPV